MKRLRLSLAIATLAACGGSDSRSDSVRVSEPTRTETLSAAEPVAPQSQPPQAVHVASSGGSVERSRPDTLRYPVIRALYLNRFAAQSARALRRHLAVADSTEINGFVIDIKDEFGLNYKSQHSQLARNVGGTHGTIRSVRALLDTLKAHGVYSIARIVVFKDPVAAALNSGWNIKTPDGGQWRDEKGNAWVNPYNKDVWEYNLGVAEEMAKLGFDEIQFDYIRFPEPYRRLAPQVFPGSDGVKKPDLLAAFVKEAKQRLSPLGVLVTADVFGLVTTVRGPLEVGQWWEKISPHVDVILPMVYPSHYPRGSFGVARPNFEPYKIIRTAIDTARVRDERLGITKAEHVRPWIQAFSIGKPEYGAEQVKAQMQAIYDAGFDGWILWSPGSKYDAFRPALERELTSRKTVKGAAAEK